MNNPLHYLPIASTVISLLFVIALVNRARERGWPPHLNWWIVGVAFYGLGTLLESIITLNGNTLMLNRLWYWAGAILGGYPLATGSVYLLHKRRTANILTGVSFLAVIVASVAVFLTPLIEGNLNLAKPSGDILAWRWVRYMTPFINGYAAIFLIGGAVQSSVRFFESPEMRGRAYGTALIAVGALLPGIGGSMAKAGIVEALYVGELLGLILIWWGYVLCTRAPKPIAGYGGDRAQVGDEVGGNSPVLSGVDLEHKPDLVAVQLGDEGTDT
jgi:hypothetical protein